MPGPGMWFAMLEVRLIEALLRSPTWHRFVGHFHRRYRHVRHGKTPEEIMEENSGTNEKMQMQEHKGALLRHFREELQNQWKDISGRGPKK